MTMDVKKPLVKLAFLKPCKWPSRSIMWFLTIGQDMATLFEVRIEGIFF